jgi:DNA ligase D-like protein (predicted 3'-phosphoesterase)
MSLKDYARKRRFGKTPEPKPRRRARTSGPAGDPVYVIQRHDASHLHWDLRLEDGGVLKSWAIPKEPPREPGIRRLAVAVEDHALEYATFEGQIPEGEYGAGTVRIWDRGTYTPVETGSGKHIFQIHGNKLEGTYCLIKLKPKDDKDKNWLFFKQKDAVPSA